MKRAHSTFRLSAETKALLRILASADDATLTAEVTRLIRDEANRRMIGHTWNLPQVPKPAGPTTADD